MKDRSTKQKDMRLKKTFTSFQTVSKILSAFILLQFLSSSPFSQEVASPSDVFGFQVGTDYKLADYDQMLDYYERLDAASDRVKKIEIGEPLLPWRLQWNGISVPQRV